MNDRIRIISVEDDPLQAAWIKQTIEEKINGTLVIQIATESEFVKKLPEIVANPPTLILLDVMLRWAEPSPNTPERPPDVKEGGMRRAGFRCWIRLSEDPESRDVPVVLYTVLEREELEEWPEKLPPRLRFLHKDSDPEALETAIRELIDQQ